MTIDAMTRIETAVMTATNAATGGTITAVAAWSHWSHTCPSCGQPGAHGPGQNPWSLNGGNPWSPLEQWSQQHGCGAWWGPWASDAVLVGADEIVEEVAELLGQKVQARAAKAIAAAREKLTDGLREQLAAVLALPPEDREPTGNETNPGVYREDYGPQEGEWVAWDYDVDTTAGDVITVYASDLIEGE